MTQETNPKLEWLKEYCDSVKDWVFSTNKTYVCHKDGVVFSIDFNMVWTHKYQELDEFGYATGPMLEVNIPLDQFQAMVRSISMRRLKKIKEHEL